MASLEKKIQHALNEDRILVLGAHVLLGLQLRSVFETGFSKLPETSRQLELLGLLLTALAVGLLLVPAAYHRIVSEGESTADLHRATSVVLEVALLPFAVGLAITLYVAVEKLAGPVAGLVAGLAAAAVALGLWYGVELVEVKQRGDGGQPRGGLHLFGAETGGDMSEKREPTSISQKVSQALTETRVVLPGAQALLGFQFVTMLTDSFEKLPDVAKYVHLGSLGLVALSTIVLMMPAAYHRIVEGGEDTQRFHAFASRAILFAMAPLALGIAGDAYVVVVRVLERQGLAIGIAAGLLALFAAGWYGLPLYRRGRVRAEQSRARVELTPARRNS